MVNIPKPNPELLDKIKEMKLGQVEETRTHEEWLAWAKKNIPEDY